MDAEYDVIIVGAGPTGMTSAIFTGRSRLKTLVIERMLPGGQIATTSTVENYPGFPDGVEGPDLSEAMLAHAKKWGAELSYDEVSGIRVEGDARIVETPGGDLRAKALIITSGADHRRLGVPGEMEYMGKGVSNCAVCDGAFFAESPVAVIGGGDGAIDEGLYLTRYASKVTVVHRRNELRASKILAERALANPVMDFAWNSVVESINGGKVVESITLKDVQSGKLNTVPVEGVFIYVGLVPNTDYLKGMLNLDPGGHILVNAVMETNIPGVFAAGDIRQKAARQLVSASGDGATAAISVRDYLRARAG
jgi:thioredoxin reductase (NADPH)